MDWDGRNALGVSPLKAQVDQVEAIRSVEELTAYLALPMEDHLSGLWVYEAMGDLTDSSRNILALDSAALLLQDSAEYAALTHYGEIKKQAYDELALKLLVRLGYTEYEAAQKIENCMAFEKMIAPVIYTAEEKGRPDFFGKALNYFTHEELRALEGNLPILEGLAADGFPEQDCYLFINPAYVKELNALYTEENLNLIKDFLIVRGSIDSVDMLDRECHDWGVEMNNAITGASGTLDPT